MKPIQAFVGTRVHTYANLLKKIFLISKPLHKVFDRKLKSIKSWSLAKYTVSYPRNTTAFASFLSNLKFSDLCFHNAKNIACLSGDFIGFLRCTNWVDYDGHTLLFPLRLLHIFRYIVRLDFKIITLLEFPAH